MTGSVAIAELETAEIDGFAARLWPAHLAVP